MIKNNITLYDSLSKQKKVFLPISKNVVKIYSCGPTLYRRAHIGNLRGYVFADTLNRLFREAGFKVKHVINLTDVGHLFGDGDTGEDKIEKEAKDTNQNIESLIINLIKVFNSDLEHLNISLKRYNFTRATSYIKEQVSLIERLEKKGFAYKISDGMYFNVQKFKSYGGLAGVSKSIQQEGKRVEINKEKKGPYDFALWKFSKKTENRLQEWSSPWGVGFPGWHTECCAMASSVLGKSIDLHTGGIDLAPTHHNNEIAQQESDTGQVFVNTWMHTEFVALKGAKLSKSDGNIINIDNLIENKIDPVALRYLFLTIHYKTPINYTDESIKAANLSIKELKNYCFYKSSLFFVKKDKQVIEQIKKAVSHDISTPKAIALLWEFLKDDSIKRSTKTKTILEIDKIFGLGLKKKKIKIPNDVFILFKERQKARENQDWKKSDILREKIKVKKFNVVDTSSGTDLFPIID